MQNFTVTGTSAGIGVRCMILPRVRGSNDDDSGGAMMVRFSGDVRGFYWLWEFFWSVSVGF